ncbi:MAG: D-2-hydroxyacid dehydrogenase [Acidimicrobiales bacterium]|nr:D-2-hydroxyacid dehydrogenase [Acidimicrobiales bacterium]
MHPIVAVIVAAGEPRPPGLDEADTLAEVRVADDADSLRRALDDGAEVLGVWDFRTTLVRDLWPSATAVRWVHAASAGVDAVLLPEVTASGVTVTNTRGLFDRGIAEFVLLATLAFAKGLPRTLELQRHHTWQHRDSESVEGRRMVVVGAGSIGRQVARLARAVGLRVSGVARAARPDDPDFDEVAAAGDLHRVLGDADVVVVTAPLTPDTAGMFDDAAFAAMPPGARLVNVGRGEIVDEAALVRALSSGRVDGAALDVFATEPLPPDSPLWDHPGVIVSPHQAGDVVGWRTALADAFVANLRRYLAGEPLHDVVHAPAGTAAAERALP